MYYRAAIINVYLANFFSLSCFSLKILILVSNAHNAKGKSLQNFVLCLWNKTNTKASGDQLKDLYLHKHMIPPFLITQCKSDRCKHGRELFFCSCPFVALICFKKLYIKCVIFSKMIFWVYFRSSISSLN